MNRSSPYHPLKWRVDVIYGPNRPWETMAAFNVSRVALGYADRCRKGKPPGFRYRVMERTARDWREITEESANG